MKKRLPKTLFVLFVTLLCILIPAYDVMTAYSAMINNALNIQSYRVVSPTLQRITTRNTLRLISATRKPMPRLRQNYAVRWRRKVWCC